MCLLQRHGLVRQAQAVVGISGLQTAQPALDNQGSVMYGRARRCVERGDSIGHPGMREFVAEVREALKPPHASAAAV
jgi:hypothetical protein